MKVQELTPMEIEAYYNLLDKLIENANFNININRNNSEEILALRSNLFEKKGKLRDEISKRINEIEFE